MSRSEEEVLDAIERRRRRPHVKLMDEHITLAHGAGGKSSHTLVETLFVRAFANPARVRLPEFPLALVVLVLCLLPLIRREFGNVWLCHPHFRFLRRRKRKHRHTHCRFKCISQNSCPKYKHGLSHPSRLAPYCDNL